MIALPTIEGIIASSLQIHHSIGMVARLYKSLYYVQLFGVLIVLTLLIAIYYYMRSKENIRIIIYKLKFSIIRLFQQPLVFFQRYIGIAFIFFFFGMLFYLLFTNRSQINSYLYTYAFDSNDNPTGFYSTFFISIGASILGVLAVTFSLSIFVIQQAAKRGSSVILNIYAKDSKTTFTYWTIVVISIIYFLLGLYQDFQFLLLELTLGFLFLITTFILLRNQYKHTIKLISPIYQINLLNKNAAIILDRIDKWMDIMILIGAIKSSEKKETDA